jgi:hypothetical protein
MRGAAKHKTGADLAGQVPGVDGYSWMHKGSNIANIAFNTSVRASWDAFVEFNYVRARTLAYCAKGPRTEALHAWWTWAGGGKAIPLVRPDW